MKMGLGKHQKMLCVALFIVLIIFCITLTRRNFIAEEGKIPSKKAEQRIIPLPASGDIRSAFRIKFGKGSDETILSELKTSQKSVLPSGTFTYFGTGFTPDGEVMITVGPLEGADSYVELTSADSKGQINGLIQMVDRDKIVFGKNMVVAMDYREMRKAVENVLTGKNNILSNYAAAQILEVVESE